MADKKKSKRIALDPSTEGGQKALQLIERFKTSDKNAKANDAYISSVYLAAYGRPATDAEKKKFSGKSVRDVTNLVLGTDSPFGGGGPPVKGGPAGVAPGGGGQAETPTGLAKYTGNGNQYGQLPKRDAGGKYSWIDATGKEQHQEGYDPSSGGWDYLGEHHPWEWESASTIYKNSPPPPTSVENMTNVDLQQYLNEAHTELSQNFLNTVQQGQSDTVYELGQAVKVFADDLSKNNLGMTEDIRLAQNALEAAGLTFQGEGKRLLGEGFAGAGILTPEQKASLTSNLQQIMNLPSTAVITGNVPAMPNMPQPAGINDAINPSTGQAWTQAEKDAAWQTVYAGPEWQNYVNAVNTASSNAPQAPGTPGHELYGGQVPPTFGRGLPGTPDMGIAGTGQYGYTGNLDPYTGTGITTAAGQGSIFRNQFGSGRTQLAESYRDSLNSRARQLGMTAEQLLGTPNLIGLTMPSIGGQSVFTPAPNVLGSLQSGYQTNLGSNINVGVGNQFENFGYTFPL